MAASPLPMMLPNVQVVGGVSVGCLVYPAHLPPPLFIPVPTAREGDPLLSCADLVRHVARRNLKPASLERAASRCCLGTKSSAGFHQGSGPCWQWPPSLLLYGWQIISTCCQISAYMEPRVAIAWHRVDKLMRYTVWSHLPTNTNFSTVAIYLSPQQNVPYFQLSESVSFSNPVLIILMQPVSTSVIRSVQQSIPEISQLSWNLWRTYTSRFKVSCIQWITLQLMDHFSEFSH